MKVFIVWESKYHDWNREGIFSSEELAEEFKKKLEKFNPNNEFHIEDELVDDPNNTNRVFKTGYVVRIDSNTENPECTNWKYAHPNEVNTNILVTPETTEEIDCFWNLIYVRSYISFEHALEVALRLRPNNQKQWAETLRKRKEDEANGINNTPNPYPLAINTPMK